MYEYNARVVDVHDGDTLRADIDCGFGVWLSNQPLRLDGLNAPELNTPAGKASQVWLAGQLPVGTQIVITTVKDAKEKYGRYLATIFLAGVNLNDELIATGHALPWNGKGPKPV